MSDTAIIIIFVTFGLFLVMVFTVSKIYRGGGSFKSKLQTLPIKWDFSTNFNRPENEVELEKTYLRRSENDIGQAIIPSIITPLSQTLPPQPQLEKPHVLTSLLATTKNAHDHLTGIVNAAKPINKSRDIWNTVAGILEPFQSDCTTTMQLMSLIKPEDWQRDENWKNYHLNIRKIALGANQGMARRLHLVDCSDMSDLPKMKLLLNLVICEYLFRIRARVLCVDRDEIIQMSTSGNAHGANPHMHFTPFDSATMTNQSGKYAVIFSDIKPYFLDNTGNTSEFTIYNFDGSYNYLYYALRSNFYRAWHQNHLGSIYCLRKLYEKVKQLNGGIPAVDDQMIHTFGATASCVGLLPSRDKIVEIIEKVSIPELGTQMPVCEQNLEQLFKDSSRCQV